MSSGTVFFHLEKTTEPLLPPVQQSQATTVPFCNGMTSLFNGLVSALSACQTGIVECSGQSTLQYGFFLFGLRIGFNNTTEIEELFFDTMELVTKKLPTTLPACVAASPLQTNLEKRNLQ